MNQKIEFSQEQFKTLVKLVFLGEWVLNANKSNYEDIDIDAEKMLEYISGESEKFSLKNWFIDTMHGVDLNNEKTEEFVRKAFEYNEETFWLVLIEKLAMRDTLREIKAEENFFDGDAHDDIFYKYEEKYEKAFKQMNLDRLELVNEK
jgi:hypothetical protein